MEGIPDKVRLSLGSAIVMGLIDAKLDAPPTTAYIMTYRDGKCLANCGFCPQAKQSRSREDMLSRVSWPVFGTQHFLQRLEEASRRGKINRVCIQALNYPDVFRHIQSLLKAVKKVASIPVSVSCQPLNLEHIWSLKEAGAERVGIPIDAATEEIFEKVKGEKAGGPYNMKKQLDLLEQAVTIFGGGKVTTHLIVGLGETEMEMVNMIQKFVDGGVLPALFAFTPVAGTALEKLCQPPIRSYRRLQIARHLIFNEITRAEKMKFDEKGQILDFGVDPITLKKVVYSGEPFKTSGCPYCNRPYYNEKPGGPIYNYPRPLQNRDIKRVIEELSFI
ncbi:MAG: radical SAM protein [Candidatus Bathyarchaeia archaeon]